MHIALLLLSACGYVPPVDTALSPPDSVALSGDMLIVQQPDGAAGPGHVLLFEADNPPPPSGFGSPVDFATVSSSAWSEAEGVVSAPWQLIGVADGAWLLTGLVDEDEDFNPFYDFTAGATCGDRTGAFVMDAASSAPQPITVQSPSSVEGLSVLVGAPLTTERPAFEIGEVDTLLRPASMDAYVAGLASYVFTLEAVGIDHPLITIDGPGSSSDCSSTFRVDLQDADGDGLVDPHPDETYAAYGLHDLWPKVYLVLAAHADGTPLEEGEAYVSEAVVYDAQFLAHGYTAGDVVETATLPLLFLPGALHQLPDGSSETVFTADMPLGAWAIMVVYENGQAWITPNDMADVDVATALGTDVLEGQGSMLFLSE